MQIEIFDNEFNVVICGFAGTALNRNWGKTGFMLMDKLWQQLKITPVKNKGKNIWVYEENNAMFAGVEPIEAPTGGTPLEVKEIALPKYAYCKHIGAYSKIGETGNAVLAELSRRGLQTVYPILRYMATGYRTKQNWKLSLFGACFKHPASKLVFVLTRVTLRVMRL